MGKKSKLKAKRIFAENIVPSKALVQLGA